MTKRQKQIEHDVEILREFTEIYCREHHQQAAGQLSLCVQCQDLLDYAIARREKCPMNPKPPCRLCRVHCYRDPYRRRIREVMKFGGMWMVRHGRVGTIARHVLSGIKSRLQRK